MSAGHAPPHREPSGTSSVADREFLVQVEHLRAAARERARSRPRAPFDGVVSDEMVVSTAVRRYLPHVRRTSLRAVFLHGGYGVFGDLDLQDGWCRHLAASWACEVIAVDYPLAPEHLLSEAVDAVEQVLAAGQTAGSILCGDSAGAALAVTTATSEHASVCGLMLTNPNIDLTLARFDPRASDGPDAELSARAFAAWTRDGTTSGDVASSARTLPPTFLAVGIRDAVLSETRDLAGALASAGQRTELVEYDTGHGFLGDDAVSADVLSRSRLFFGM